MKKLLFAFTLLLTSSSLFASHFAGGEIWYEHKPTPGFPNRYDVYLLIYRDIAGVSMCPGYCPVDICITSSCYPTQNITLQLLPFHLQPGSDTAVGSYPGSIVVPNVAQCVNPNSPGLVFTEVYRFKATIDLPGSCADFRFAYSEGARNSSDNLIGQDYFHIKADLNNTLSSNSSPCFVTSGSTSFCAGVPTIWQQSAIDADGDSLYYELGRPLGGSQCGSPYPISYTTGYSQNAPITTSGGITLNHNTGILSFTPSQLELVVVNILVSEYRYDSTFGVWYQIGNTMRDVQVPIVSSANCSAPLQSWFSVENTTMQGGASSLLKCSDSVVNLSFEEDILISTIASDGTDFALVNSLGNILPITGISYSGNSTFQTRNIQLHLYQPIYYNDSLTLSIRKGSDLNTLETVCSRAVPEGDSVIVKVVDCASNISLSESALQKASIYPNPVQNTLRIKSLENQNEATVTITDYSGRRLIEKRNHQLSEVLNISTLPNGIYLLHIATSKWTETLKFEKL